MLLVIAIDPQNENVVQGALRPRVHACNALIFNLRKRTNARGVVSRVQHVCVQRATHPVVVGD